MSNSLKDQQIKNDFVKKKQIVLFSALLILLAIHLFHIFFSNIYLSNSNPILHNFLELFTVNITFFIALQGWLLFPYKIPARHLLISALFLPVGVFDLLHILFHEKFGLAIYGGSLKESSWFWMLARLTEAIGMFSILLFKQEKIERVKRSCAYGGLLIYTFLVASVFIIVENNLPALINRGFGPTELKIILDSIIISLYLLSVLILYWKYRLVDFANRIILYIAITFLILAEIVLTYYHLHSIDYILGSFYRIIFYYYILQIIFINNIKAPFVEKQLIEKDNYENLQMFNWIIEQIPTAVLVVDHKYRILLANQKAKEYFQSDGNSVEPRGQNIKYFLSRKGLKDDEMLTVKAIRDGLEFVKEKVRIDNKVYQLDISLIRNPGNEEILGAATYFSDITKEETESAERQKMLLEYFNQSKNLQILIDSIPIAFLGIDSKLRIIAFNNQVANIFGLAKDVKLLGKHLSYITEIKGNDYQGMQIYKALQGKNIVNEHASIRNLNLLVNAYPISDNNGEKIIGAVALYQDITELENLRSEMGNIERLNLVGQMAASITHEIRNPMATVRGFIQLLSEQADKGKEGYYSIILNELDRANGIITDFLSLSQSRVLEMNECNLNEIIKELQPIIMADTNIKGQYFELLLDERLPNLLLNKKEIKQLLLNLARNGTEAMTSGGKLIISTRLLDNQVELLVTDTGSGISQEKIGRIFEPFFTTKERGTGLGLSVTKSIVDKHHGQIRINSNSGDGTTFIISFNRL